uniref:GNAT family N-acetyltransferase n=1 Tax=Pedobacter schmidteae TaxID=2201271 RepID=UPI000EB4042C|nr:GNAT family N-acetyltransferase [Pedobacter schmidteae]
MIREARPEDASAVARLIILAMEDLAMKFTGATDPYEAVPLFEKFAAMPANQYSYENMLVYEAEGVVCGMISAYNGADLKALRAPFLAYVAATFGFNETPADETEEGEYYLDCISVAPGNQGKGIGQALIKAMVGYAAEHHYPRLGLLVSKENPKAKKLYTNLGFKVVKDKHFMGGEYFHMQHC